MKDDFSPIIDGDFHSVWRRRKTMKGIVTLLGFVLAAVLLLALGGGLLVLLAYGVGWVVNLLMDLEPFQATMLGLAGIFTFIILVDRVVHALTPLTTPMDDFEFEDDYEDEDEDESEEYEIFEDEEEMDKAYAGIPRWRRPARSLDFSNVHDNDRCPCGSGRKYKNCHGAKPRKI
jgi:hypothetical protein